MANEREHTNALGREQAKSRQASGSEQAPGRGRASGPGQAPGCTLGRRGTATRERAATHDRASTRERAATHGRTPARRRVGGDTRESAEAGTKTSARTREAETMPRTRTRASVSTNTSNAARANTRTDAATWANSNAKARRSPSDKLIATKPAANVRLVAIAAAVVILLVFVVSIVRGCASADAPEPNTSNASTPATSQAAGQAEATNPESQIDIELYRDQVFSWLEDDYANQLMDAAKTNEDAAWIVSHIDDYAIDGSSVQYKLLKLAATEPEARSFVRNWPAEYPSEQAQPSDASWNGRIPHLYQWDKRWGYTLYCNTTFALTGCCPTSLAMVYQGLTGSSDLSPYDLGVMAAEKGYMDTFNGTSTAFLTDCAPELGLNCWSVSVSAEAITSALSAGNVLICNVGPGDFTTGGHFIVLAGLDAAGNVVVNDPFSAERSAVSWSADTIVSQTKALWAYSLA